jgi:putative hydrolase of the HAD superfamily
MVNAIIFDFGDIFINLDNEAPIIAFNKLGLYEWNDDLRTINRAFEKGEISELEFIEGFQKYLPDATIEDIRIAWNSILLDFPLYRLEFLQLLSSKYRLFLLSNTDSIHIDKFQQKVGESFYSDFYQCFEKVYFSFELGLRKPEVEIFNYVLNKNDLTPKRTLFVDDKKENTDAAKALGINVWNLKVGQEDVVQLFENGILTP